MTGERPPAGAGGGGGGGGFGGNPESTPPEYRSGFGAEGVKALQAFVEKGGTLLTFANAGDLPIQRFGLPVRNVLAGLSPKQFWSPGSTLRVRFDNSNPIVWGMPAEGLALVPGRRPGLRSDVDRSQPGRRDPVDLHRSRHPAERLAARRAGHREEGRRGVGEAWPGQGRPDRVPAAASRSDARHVQVGLQRVAERAVVDPTGINRGAAIAWRWSACGR